MNSPTSTTQHAAQHNGGGTLKKAVAPAAGALVGTSAMVLLVELARSGALEQYKDLLAPLIGWGPGLLIVAGFLWLAHSYAPPFIESQRHTATALQKLADTVEHSATSQHDLVLAMQVNSDKLEQLRGTVEDLQEQVRDSRLVTRYSAAPPEPGARATGPPPLRHPSTPERAGDPALQSEL
jgi:hypothetical protein